MTDVAQAPASPALGPVREQDRIEAIDVLRGVAILGILVVNMGLFSMPEVRGAQSWPGVADTVAQRLIFFAAQEKFKALFSFLFGLGLAVQMLRADGRGVRFVPIYARRLAGLFLIGTVHFVFLWDGDILRDYVRLACALLIFRRRSFAALLIWAGVFLAIPLLLYSLTTYSAFTGHWSPQVASWAAYENGTGDPAEAAETARLYSRGTYAEMVRVRTHEFPEDLLPDADDAFVFAMFLLGLYAGRRRIFHDVRAHGALLRRVLGWGLVIGIAGNAVFTAGGAYDPAPDNPMENLGRLCLILAAPALTFSYAAAIALLTQRPAWKRRLAPLAAVGRTALSNYLLQSLICTTIFYSYGLALFGRVGPFLGLLMTVGVFLIQVPLSVWWLRRFQFGPIEWLWRSLTYWQRQPLRVRV